jgi:hypothetical protein
MTPETDLVALLVKGVRALEPQEQDAVLTDLLTRIGLAGLPAGTGSPAAPRPPAPWWTFGPPAPVVQPLGDPASLGEDVLIPAGAVPIADPFTPEAFARPAGPLQALPVRLPQDQYERLKRWCAEHEYTMATVVRGLVERFLDEQADPASSQTES